MRKMLMAIPFLFLSSCGTTGGLSQDQVNALVTQIQATTAALCQFQPTASTVVSLISAFYAPASVAATIVNDVSRAICLAPTTSASVRRGVATVTKIVNTPKGAVVVKGSFYGAVR